MYDKVIFKVVTYQWRSLSTIIWFNFC